MIVKREKKKRSKGEWIFSIVVAMLNISIISGGLILSLNYNINKYTVIKIQDILLLTLMIITILVYIIVFKLYPSYRKRKHT